MGRRLVRRERTVFIERSSVMYRHFLLATTLVPALLMFSVLGCGGSKSSSSNSYVATKEANHEHEHAREGLHGGSLIELGNEEYHAEIVHDDQARTVTVYLLDAAAKASVPIDTTDMTINLKHEGRGEQFKLAAAPDQSDPQGKSSRFVSSDAELAEDLDREDAGAQLAVTINSKPYRGAIEHHHGHDEDDHEHAHE
jgi:hypothetical protein